MFVSVKGRSVPMMAITSASFPLLPVTNVNTLLLDMLSNKNEQ